MSPNDSRSVLLEIDDRKVASLILNRPAVNNAYNGDFIQDMLSAIDAIDKVARLRAVVIKGKGKHFQAGADLNWINTVRVSSPEENVRVSRATAEAVQRLNLAPVPTVAQVQGACFGGGTGIIAACDVVIAADNAIFSIAEVRWGLTAAIIIPQLNDAISVRQVRRYALTGERFDAQEARRIGLVHQVVPLSELEAAGARVVDQLLQNGREAISQTKALAIEAAGSSLDKEKFKRLIEAHARKRQSAEAAEGLLSFVEKRTARWRKTRRLSVSHSTFMPTASIQGVISVLPTRRPKLKSRPAVVNRTRKAERTYCGSRFHAPLRTMWMLQSPLVQAEPSAGASL
jgi:methylglutaconyl-CoA hydratase